MSQVYGTAAWTLDAADLWQRVFPLGQWTGDPFPLTNQTSGGGNQSQVEQPRSAGWWERWSVGSWFTGEWGTDSILRERIGFKWEASGFSNLFSNGEQDGTLRKDGGWVFYAVGAFGVTLFGVAWP